MPTMTKVYISGPIMYARGEDRFGPIKNWLADQGIEALNPKDVEGCPDNSCTLLPHEAEKGMKHSWKCFMKYDILAMLTECDAILMMDGWEDSHGAKAELSTAVTCGLTVIFERDLS